ncbi:hypothetical protein SAMN06269185_1655 [Natronoarchaeum philippinense]|uniref:Uncharacterized protein n=1 Tax=Natronoarchaeum philippinense TaxID=558529 RepID=A0A285NTW4_NATPI|nr:hypothetical protein [Natronoarchaeum philippinense]SNZ12363.1 hypothetical protein SAMN06269185_1655 [Natronoarchaeum philippinense]
MSDTRSEFDTLEDLFADDRTMLLSADVHLLEESHIDNRPAIEIETNSPSLVTPDEDFEEFIKEYGCVSIPDFGNTYIVVDG